MRRHLVIAVAAVAWLATGTAKAAEHRLGFGFHYWKTVDELKQDEFRGIKDKGVSQELSYQYLPGGLLRFELDLEYFDKGFGGSTSAAWAPQAYVLVGRGFYAGVGVGVTHSSGFESGSNDDTWWAGKLGVDMVLVPGLHLDISGNYRPKTFSELDKFNTDTVTLAAIARISF